MEHLYYSTGQVARQLGITLATVRLLCENRAIAAETTPGGQWRVRVSEVERLKRDGLPTIPRGLPTGRVAPVNERLADHHRNSESAARPSEAVVAATDQVAITRSTLERRKIEREIEENEDWFRERERRAAESEIAERQRTDAEQAAQLRVLWIQEWTRWALDSLPSGARREVELEVHALVQKALSGLQPSQAEAITRRLVEAAVHKALGPWMRKQNIERALQTAMNGLPWEIRHRADHATLKQRAWEAAVASLGKVREEANYREMETTAVHALQPMIREYEHMQACHRIVERELEYSGRQQSNRMQLIEALRQALAALPIGASAKQLETAEEEALAPYRAEVTARKEKARLESEKEAQRRAAAFKVDLQLDHIERYLEKEYEFDGLLEMRREADRLRPLIREALIEQVLRNHEMTREKIREGIENEIDDRV